MEKPESPHWDCTISVSERIVTTGHRDIGFLKNIWIFKTYLSEIAFDL